MLLNFDEENPLDAGYPKRPVGDAIPPQESAGSDAILAALMKQMQDEQTGVNDQVKVQQDQNRSSILKKLIPLGLAALATGVASGGRQRGGNNAAAVMMGGMRGLGGVREARDSSIAASGLKRSEGIDKRRELIMKGMSDIAVERAKGKASPDARTAEQKNFDYGQSNPNFLPWLDKIRGRTSDPTEQKVLGGIYDSYLKTGKMTPQQEAILKSIAGMRAYQGMYLYNQFDPQTYRLPNVVPGGPSRGLTPP